MHLCARHKEEASVSIGTIILPARVLLKVCGSGRNGHRPSANRDNISLPTLRYRPPCRCRRVCVRHRRCRLATRFPSHDVLSFHPRAQRPRSKYNTSTVQNIMPAAMHADSGRRQGQAPGAHYPNACAARHRLLFAASRTLRAVSKGETRRQPLRAEL
jgi:hypothetical protein